MKRSSLLFRVCIGYFLLGVSFLQSSYAQNSNSINPIAKHAVLSDGYFKPQSPDVWSMIKYGDASINHYSGTLGLSIPVYTYKDSDFEIPVSIDYASSGYQPGTDCGVAGMGWYLNVGGAVTREVRGRPDDAVQELFDWRYKLDTLKNFIPWWDEYTYPDEGTYIYDHMVRIDGYAQSYFKTTTADSLNFVYTGSAGQEYMPYWKDENQDRHGFETEPDVFHFKFLDYSGSFILQPHKQVKVFNTNKPAGEFEIEFRMNYSEPKATSKFIITTGDKMKYYFEHREFCQAGSGNASETDTGTPYTWKLSRIESPCGAVVRFVYRTDQTTSVTMTPAVTVDRIVLRDEGGYVLSDKQQIQSPDEPANGYYMLNNFVNENFLDSIVIEKRANIVFSYSAGGLKDSRHLSSVRVYNTDRDSIKSCSFEYVKSSGNNKLKFLKSLILSGEGRYTMNYYDETAQYERQDTYKTDMYNYYNGDESYIQSSFPADLTQLAERLRTWRAPNTAFTRMGMLQTLHYPAGGYSVFTYEQNDCSRELNDLGDLGKNIKIGGLRIRQIDTFAKDGVQTQSRSFKYQRADNGNLSSGILLRLPAYYFKYTASASSVKIDRELVSSLGNIGFSKENYFEYTRVIEEVRKHPTDSTPLAITEYNFFSANGNDNNDKPKEKYDVTENNSLIASDGWEIVMTKDSSSEINDSMLSTSTFRGGKLRSKIEYTGDMDHPVKREEYSYGNFGDVNEPVSVLTVFMCQAVEHQYIMNSIFPDRQLSEIYNKNSELIYRNDERRTTNDSGRINAITRTDSRGNEICDMYSYLDAVPAYPTELIRTANGKVISATKYDYVRLDDETDHYVPSKVSVGAIAPDLSAGDIEYRTDCTYDFYDAMGHPWEMTDRNGKSTCYVWGYEGQYLIAKIENMTYGALSAQYGITNDAYPDAFPDTEENMLRGIEGTAVTTYAYKPLVGVTRITDPTGYSVYYEYDDNGKLKIIRDGKGKVLKSYDYHIVTDNQ